MRYIVPGHEVTHLYNGNPDDKGTRSYCGKVGLTCFDWSVDIGDVDCIACLDSVSDRALAQKHRLEAVSPKQPPRGDK